MITKEGLLILLRIGQEHVQERLFKITEDILKLQTKDRMKLYRCPECERVWTEIELWHSEGTCLTEDCGWEDELELLE